jgi:hypothetical protein
VSSPDAGPTVELSLPLKTAETLHAALEDLLEGGGRDEAALEKAYRVLAWRVLAVKGGTGLTARMAELARKAESVEEYEAARDRVLGPILDGLESAENRDP